MLIPVSLPLRIGDEEQVHPVKLILHNHPEVLPLSDLPLNERLLPTLLGTLLHPKHRVHHYSLLPLELYELGLLEFLFQVIIPSQDPSLLLYL